MTYYSEMGLHHFVQMQNLGAIDTSPGNSFSALISVGNIPPGESVNVVFECAPEDPANPGNPDNTAWAPLEVRQDQCDPNSPLVPAQVQLNDTHPGHVVEAALNLCGCRFLRANITATPGVPGGPNAVHVIGMFGHLRRSEPPA